MRNSWKRKLLAVLAVGLLSVPSAVGVQRALEPTRGPVAAWLAAAGFECVYLATAMLVLNSELRRYAQRVALAAVTTAVALNSVADYAQRIPGGLAGWSQAQRLFDPLALTLAVLESVPLAALAFAMASLLHRIAEAEDAPLVPVQAEPSPALSAARSATFPEPVPVHIEDARDARPESTDAPLQACPKCGAPLDPARWRAARRWGHCASCKVVK